jgi:hypothetical protein
MRKQDRRPTVRRNLRALALAAVGGLLLAPASTAFATSDVFMPKYPGPEQTAPPKAPHLIDRDTQTIDIGSRYDGKTIPG